MVPDSCKLQEPRKDVLYIRKANRDKQIPLGKFKKDATPEELQCVQDYFLHNLPFFHEKHQLTFDRELVKTKDSIKGRLILRGVPNPCWVLSARASSWLYTLKHMVHCAI